MLMRANRAVVPGIELEDNRGLGDISSRVLVRFWARVSKHSKIAI